MILVSWNVNGLRACIKKGFMDFLNYTSPDVLCLQETKMQEGQEEIETPGWHQYWCSAEKKGYSGTLTLTKKEPLSVSYGMGREEHDKEGRIVTAEYENFYLVNVYVPNSKEELKRLDYRMQWEEAFLEYVKDLEKGKNKKDGAGQNKSEPKPVIICGDMNVAHKEIDLKNPKSNRRNAGFTDEEREKMTRLQEAGFIDTFRYFYPDMEGIYSWWSYRFKARERNAGWRIDYFLVSEALEPDIISASIHTDVHGSDHCPVSLVISIP